MRRLCSTKLSWGDLSRQNSHGATLINKTLIRLLYFTQMSGGVSSKKKTFIRQLSQQNSHWVTLVNRTHGATLANNTLMGRL